jgi:hypothetical protein
VWNWLDPATQALHQPDAVAGQIWALTPFRTLTLVHATKSPLFAPNFIGTPTVTRQVGETFASPNGSLSFSRSSTSKLQVIANWPEPRDGGPDAPDLPSLAGAHPITTAHAFDIPADVINHATSDQVPVAGEQHHFRDTKYRLVTYSTIGTTAFTEYFVERTTVVLTGVAPVVVDTDHQGFAPGTLQVTATDGSGTIYRAGTDFVGDDVHMTVARVATGAIPDGARVGVAFVEPQLTLQGNSVNVAIPSTARPAAPKVLYIVPAWQRTTTNSGNVHTVSRQGGSLRVYLDRPWWSSGDGEELGVVLDPSNGAGSVPDPQLAPYVTRWGQDPIFSSATVTANLPGLSAFPNRVVEATPALHNLAELPGGKQVYVAGHSVGFDPTRNLWYCDIDVAPGQTYFPFVRLALARYQPNSITDPAQGDLALSPVVVADFAQLTPNRSVTVAGTATPGQYQVTVVGTSYTAARDATSSGGQLSGPALFSAWVEQRSSDYLGDFGWQVVAGSRVDNITGTVQAGGDTMWTTTLTVPNRTWPFRVVLEEYEQLSQDNPASPASAGNPNSFLVGKRMVFNEIVPVTPDVVGILSVTPSGIAFGSILVGKTSALATITVSNPGTAPFTAGPVQLSGPDAGRFTISSDNVSNATFAPGAKRTVQVSFKATAVGTFNAQIQITTANGVGGPATVNLNASGVQPLCQVTPTAFSFGSVKVGTRSAAQTVTLTNTGTADLHVVSVAINGSSSQFRLSPSITGATVHPGASLTSQLTFAPTSTGVKNARVVLTTDSPNSPQVITLTGTGV